MLKTLRTTRLARKRAIARHYLATDAAFRAAMLKIFCTGVRA